ncbi:hypothetical protein D9613_006513 [Agrocybe pediades]|uniref:F-box domain-containing protein n=1 Tax=Agrocybe pediades TaxID=84607 RepID=A0A8H4VJT7_9AGAR|nr:hypothetical protein D9613_006513 [Agrocybe pediades]
MVALPPEIWLYIFDFLTNKNEIYRLISVNRIFLEVGLNLYWKNVIMSTGFENIEKTMHTLKRLSDPFITNRVKKLEIDFRYFKPAKPSTPISYMASTRNQGNQKSLKISMTKPLVDRILSTFRRRRSIPAPASHDTVPPPRSWPELVSRIIQALPECRNVNDLRLDWMDIPSSYDPKVVLRDLWSWSPIAPNLKALSLAGDLAFYQAFTETMPLFPKLASLRINLSRNYSVPNPLMSDSSVLLNHVIPFINAISLNLQFPCVRSFTTWVGLSAFFNNLPVLPVLHNLSIFLYVDWSPEDLCSLYLFLDGCQSNTLQYLDLELDTSEREPLEDLSKTLLRLFTSTSRSFMNLHSLTISPTRTARAVDIIIAILQKTRTTIHKLHVRERVFNSEELSVLDMLAEKLPRLRTLSVIANRRPIFSEEEQLDFGDGMTEAPICYTPLGSLEDQVYVSKSRLNRMTIRRSDDGSLDVDNKFRTT